MSHTY